MTNHCLPFLITAIVITAISNEAFVLQCQNCRCLPDYCPQTVPRSLCPCGGTETSCSRRTAEIQPIMTSARNFYYYHQYQQQQQQQIMIPQASGAQYFLLQQPIQSVAVKIPDQVITEKQQQRQQQVMQPLTSLKQHMLPQQVRIGGIQQPSPVYFVRTIEQPGQVFRQVQQISEPLASPQYIPAIPVQQAQFMLVPSMQQTQPFFLPIQIPMQTVTLQVPVTMAEHCTPRINACPLGLPSIHAVTECDNVTNTAATRCITADEARKLYTCLPQFNFNKLWDN
ncbi:unnamed protein product [Litomosoides sigmodontis]|uniref:Uncharacterized protein n=1 Tax=Litomosoides sigmodontis TaxID=42156 RepID=A0A3P6T133_LITSI|nr:unnamed protein product [Litomosoides sigmodontis]